MGVISKAKKKDAPQITELIISKDQLIQSTPKFLNEYKRLPYMREDKVEIEVEREVKDKDGKVSTEIVEQSYTALKYVRGHFGSKQAMTDYLFDKEILSFKIISDMIGINEKRTRELVNGDTKNINRHERRMIDIFFNDDMYGKKGKYKKVVCTDCNDEKKTGQNYWAGIVSIGKKREKKK